MYAAMLMALTFMVKVTTPLSTTAQSSDPRLEEELKCLNDTPENKCDLAVTYPTPLLTLGCNYLVAEDEEIFLKQAPAVNARGLNGPISRGLLLMFDPDAEVSEQPIDGILHWIALVSTDDNGNLEVNQTITEYHPPSPPRGRGSHRYQLFLFDLPTADVVAPEQRRFQLCPFIQNYTLNQPLGAFQYRYERT